MEKYIEKATFSEIYKLLKLRNNKELLKSFTGIFKVGLIFLPGLLFPEEELMSSIGNGINILEAAQVIGNVINNIHSYFKGKKYRDYRTRYEDMQIAHYLITYAAFFDTIKEYLPNENREINLQNNEKLIITEDAINKYIDTLKNGTKNNSDNSWLEHNVVLPNPLCSYSKYLKKLKHFYKYYSNSFFDFYTKLECWESLKEENKDQILAVIRNLPEKAVENYKKQYFELSCSFKDFEIWANQQERRGIENEIDVGFKRINKSISNLIEDCKNKTIIDILNKQSKLYSDHISQSIFKDDTEPKTKNQVFFPSKSEIFVPQQFQAIRYTDNTKLEPKETWKNIDKQDNIGEFIGTMLHHPDCNTKPLIILGDPGAGKSLLCNMLAAKLLYQEYHVIIVTLRDARADDTIQQQIIDQIKRGLGANCSWYDISSSNLNKPLLIIFDGYDELLQSSGKAYSSYISDISDFQRTQLITSDLQVKCIITSRTVLIDKAYIPDGATILKLCDFDETRIDTWINIWNEYNSEYFKENKLKEFSLPDNSKVSELAHQPLLLMMLALYDSNDNKLDKEINLTQTQLYNNLISDFVLRERKKDKKFDKLNKQNLNVEIDEEIKKIGIIAIGMYNRNIYHIISDDLNADINFYKSVCSIINVDSSLDDDALTEAEKWLGSFFFMYKSLSTDFDNKNKKKKVAYEFLHNTFGEFLTARFIFSNLFESIENIIFSLEHNRQIIWDNVLTNQWYSSLMYIPLFYKPVVISMLKEWSSIIFSESGIDKKDVKNVLDKIANMELEKIIHGDMYITLNEIINKRENVYPSNDLLYHVATYSINIIMLQNILTDSNASLELVKLNSAKTLKKLSEMWKYAFQDEDLLKFSHLFQLNRDDNSISILYNDKNIDSEYSKYDRLEEIYDISMAIGDTQTQSMAGCLIGNYSNSSSVYDAISVSGLDIKSKYCIFSIIDKINNFDNYRELFEPLFDLIYNNNDIKSTVYCLSILKFILENNSSNYKKNIQSYIESLLEIIVNEIRYKIKISLKYNSNLVDQFSEILYKGIIDDKKYIDFINKNDILMFWYKNRLVGYWGIKCINRVLEIIKLKKFYFGATFKENLLEVTDSILREMFDGFGLRTHLREFNSFLSISLMLNETIKLCINILSNNTFKYSYISDRFKDVFKSSFLHDFFQYFENFKSVQGNFVVEFFANYIILMFHLHRQMNFEHLRIYIYEWILEFDKNSIQLYELYNFSEEAVFKLLYMINDFSYDIPISKKSIKVFMHNNNEIISNRVLKQLRIYCIRNNFTSLVTIIEKYFEL